MKPEVIKYQNCPGGFSVNVNGRTCEIKKTDLQSLKGMPKVAAQVFGFPVTEFLFEVKGVHQVQAGVLFTAGDRCFEGRVQEMECQAEAILMAILSAVPVRSRSGIIAAA